MRVYELAKELGHTPKEFVKLINSKNIKVKNHLVSIDDKTIKKIRKILEKTPVSSSPAKKASSADKPKKKRAKRKAKNSELPKETTPRISLIDKPAHTEKEVRAFRPQELEEKERKSLPKEKRRIKLFTKSLTFKQAILKGKPPASVPGTGKPHKPFVAKKPTGGRKIIVESPVTIRNISEKIGVKANEIIQKLMSHDVMATVNDELTEDTLIMIGLEFNCDIELKSDKDILSKLIKAEEDKDGDMSLRPPVVVVMGHVDHGKTTLLDKIRKTNVVSEEAGEITQHIGAYQASVNNRKITFIDTPGHEAFTNMRSRGANVTDIAILVVAADDGVMPQTEEAVNHIKAANVTVIVAVNKIDKKEANVMRIKQQLANMDLIPEDWGGKTVFAEVSALTGQGVDHLLEMLLLQAELLELKANPKRKAAGVVLEARLKEKIGSWATILVQNGVLRKGDAVICGGTYGKIRSMYDDKLKQVDQAFPSTPVGITGLVELPEVGDKLFVVDDVKAAKDTAEKVQRNKKTDLAASTRHVTMENLFSQIEEGKTQGLQIIIKADTKGSLEVLLKTVESLSTDELKIKIIHGGVGSIAESDVLLADASDAIIVGFNVISDDQTKLLAQEKNIQIKTYKVIYKLMEDIKLALEGLLKPEKVEVVTGHLTVRELFKISRLGTIAGCMVADGKVERSNKVRVKRDAKTVHEGKIESLKRFKEDVKDVVKGFECGIKLELFDGIQVGDIIESYRIEEKSRKII